MGYGVYEVNGRDAGYHVPAICDHPDCNEEIDRGVSYVCGDEPGGGEHGCGFYFCGEHLLIRVAGLLGDEPQLPQRCERCCNGEQPFDMKPDHLQWVGWKLQHKSWQDWRDDNPEEVSQMQQRWDTEPRSKEFMAEFEEIH
jgi:hypothetical protein